MPRMSYPMGTRGIDVLAKRKRTVAKDRRKKNQEVKKAKRKEKYTVMIKLYVSVFRDILLDVLEHF